MRIPEELYAKFHQSMPIICVDIVVTYDGKILLIKRSREPEKNKWWFPGGRLLRDEDLLAAVPRIVKLEIGLNLKNAPVPLGFAETKFLEDPFSHGGGTHTINFVYLVNVAELDMLDIVLDQYHTDYRSYSLSEIYVGDFHHYVKRFVAISEPFVSK